MRRFKFDWLRIAVHAGALAPLALLIWDAANGLLSVNPIQDVTLRTGRTALTLLVISLACTPANTVFGFKQALKVRRALGVYAFMYAGLHFLTFVYLDFGLDLELIGQAIGEKRFVLVGFAAFLILLPLAITSTKGWKKRMGRRWKALHRLVYLAALLAVAHFIWLVKSDISEPVRFGIVVVTLLALRIPAIRGRASRLRDRLRALRRSRQGGNKTPTTQASFDHAS